MPTDLTDADRAAIEYVVSSWLRAKPGYNEPSLHGEIYRAGLAAGRARAIEECAKVCEQHPSMIANLTYAAALRALNAPAASVVEP